MGTLDSSMEERISIWDAGMALFKQNPFWGEGPLTYMHSYPRINALIMNMLTVFILIRF